MIKEETKEQIRAIMRAKNLDLTLSQFPKTRKWVESCYNRPRAIEIKMSIADEILEGYGVESLEGEYVDNYYYNCQALYVNLGDTYIETLIYDTVTEKYHFGCWGDMIENNPARFGMENDDDGADAGDDCSDDDDENN